jgi:hypothetical protein
MVPAADRRLLAYGGLLGETAAAFSPFIALGLSMALAPLLAWATGGRYYLARQPSAEWQPGELVRCVVCENQFESEDMARCPAYAAPSARCAARWSRAATTAARPARARPTSCAPSPRRCCRAGGRLRVNFRVGHYVDGAAVAAGSVMAFLLGVVYVQESLAMPAQACACRS